jgi:hypothetical protein
MTDALMKIYLEAIKDGDFLRQVKEVTSTPESSSSIEDKKFFAYLYTGWLLGTGKWGTFETEKEIFQ